jgi:hypothetical protein
MFWRVQVRSHPICTIRGSRLPHPSYWYMWTFVENVNIQIKPVGIMRGQCIGIYTHMGVGRTMSMRAHPKDEAYACGRF